jgi:hypothetical protein
MTNTNTVNVTAESDKIPIATQGDMRDQIAVEGTGTPGRIAKFATASTITDSIITESADKIVIGPAAALGKLTVTSIVAADPAIFGESPGVAIFGLGSTSFPGVFGRSTSGNGVAGTSSSGNANGVIGTSSSGNGVRGFSISAQGVQGESISNIGVRGFSANGIGVQGNSTSNYGMFGISNTNDGVIGLSTDGNGVRGISTNGIGVRGFSTVNDGVAGVAINDIRAGVSGAHPGAGYGIYGECLGSGLAGYFYGDVGVRGRLTKGSGGFKIDHPIDPTNKTLTHSFVESPDMMNIYNGNTITDAQGNATITLPAYFQALNCEFRYQLTVIEQFAQAIVSSEIQENHFTIKTDKPHVKVSWMVTGVRQDAYANAHRITVEDDKPAKEQGTYIHPVEHGQPQNKGVNQPQQIEEMRSMNADAALQLLSVHP